MNNYEGFLGTELEPGTEPRAHATAEVAATQKAIEDAERAYWALRAELLGQVGPTWTPGASQVSDWFSDEDTVYDGLTEEDDP
ncbi:MAG: hypothetical protein HYU28_11045 [Actinobacteria bacterium]|nr:hypothetical protein [Actinomycetota bacterium]